MPSNTDEQILANLEFIRGKIVAVLKQENVYKDGDDILDCLERIINLNINANWGEELRCDSVMLRLKEIVLAISQRDGLKTGNALNRRFKTVNRLERSRVSAPTFTKIMEYEKGDRIPFKPCSIIKVFIVFEEYQNRYADYSSNKRRQVRLPIES